MEEVSSLLHLPDSLSIPHYIFYLRLLPPPTSLLVREANLLTLQKPLVTVQDPLFINNYIRENFFPLFKGKYKQIIVDALLCVHFYIQILFKYTPLL